MNVFIDIGAWDGTSAEFFLRTHPQARSFNIYSFECDKRNIQTIIKKRLPVFLIEGAAWVKNGIAKYYYGNDDGGTLYKSKKTGNINPNNFYEVPCFDIAEFIKTKFIKTDNIIIKLNCEGAEYGIIPHLKKAGLIDWIDKWFVQWHYRKIGMTEADHNNVVKMIPGFCEWNCQCLEQEFKPIFLDYVLR